MTTYEADLDVVVEPGELPEMAGLNDAVTDRVVVDVATSVPALRHETNTGIHRPGAGTRFGVRAFDLLAGTAILVAVSPIMIGAAIAVLVTSGAPVIYRSNRFTIDGKEFEIWKFRSMDNDAERALQEHLDADPLARQEYERFHKLEHDPRVTPLGRFLRRTSIDELPQLLNVVRGDMSLVGPRPMVSWECELVGEVAVALQTVKSGVTGAWQISGRSTVSFVERIEMELDYVRTRTLVGDVKIAFGTVSALLQRRGAQ